MISRAAQPLDADTERELVAKGANRLRMMSLLETHQEQSAIARATAKHGRRLPAPQWIALWPVSTRGRPTLPWTATKR